MRSRKHDKKTLVRRESIASSKRGIYNDLADISKKMKNSGSGVGDMFVLSRRSTIKGSGSFVENLDSPKSSARGLEKKKSSDSLKKGSGLDLVSDSTKNTKGFLRRNSLLTRLNSG